MLKTNQARKVFTKGKWANLQSRGIEIRVLGSHLATASENVIENSLPRLIFYLARLFLRRLSVRFSSLASTA